MHAYNVGPFKLKKKQFASYLTTETGHKGSSARDFFSSWLLFRDLAGLKKVCFVTLANRSTTPSPLAHFKMIWVRAGDCFWQASRRKLLFKDIIKWMNKCAVLKNALCALIKWGAKPNSALETAQVRNQKCIKDKSEWERLSQKWARWLGRRQKMTCSLLSGVSKKKLFNNHGGFWSWFDTVSHYPASMKDVR